MQTAPTPNRDKRPSLANEEKPSDFGDCVTGDHFIARDEFDRSIEGHKAGLVLFDVGTQYLDCFPVVDKSAESAAEAMQEFQGKDIVTLFYSDCAPELTKAAKALGWPRDEATPGQPATNGIAENKVKKVQDGTRTILAHAGLPDSFWNYACRYFCFGNNLAKDSVLKTSSYERRRPRDDSLKGLLRIPFGALVDFLPSPVQGKQTPKFAPNLYPAFS